MKSLDQHLAAANSLLAPYAVPHGGGLGRLYPETEDNVRFPFQRDRDRIISTDAFKRLGGKMQVLPPSFSDHIRNRGTHTLEVANLARTLARALGLNEDLAECIALAHDLGHPPFGHAGESALHVCTNGKFEHNEQSLRIVTTLAEHSGANPGLNLSREITNGMQKHSGNANHLEGQVVDIADAMTYTAHDPEDGIDAKLLTTDAIRKLALGSRALELSDARGTSLRGAILHLLVADFLATTREKIQALNIRTLDDVMKQPGPIVGYSDAMRDMLKEFRDFLHAEFYNHPTVLRETEKGQIIVKDLYAHYNVRPPKQVKDLQERTSSTLEVAVTDYIAGMTDDFAKRAHAEITNECL
ncbi:MAG: dGTP triphosphohydrolase [Candidatus Peribacteraceae bacterium]